MRLFCKSKFQIFDHLSEYLENVLIILTRKLKYFFLRENNKEEFKFLKAIILLCFIIQFLNSIYVL